MAHAGITKQPWMLPWAAAAAYVGGVVLTWRADRSGWLVVVPLLAAALGLAAAAAGKWREETGGHTDRWAPLLVWANGLGCVLAGGFAAWSHKSLWAVAPWLVLAALVVPLGLRAHRRVVATPVAPLAEPVAAPGPLEGWAAHRLLFAPLAAVSVAHAADLAHWLDVLIAWIVGVLFLGLRSGRALAIAAAVAWSGVWVIAAARLAGVRLPSVPMWVSVAAIAVAVAVTVRLLVVVRRLVAQEPGALRGRARIAESRALLQRAREVAAYGQPGRSDAPPGASQRDLQQAGGGVPADLARLLAVHDGWPRLVGDVHISSLAQLRAPSAQAQAALDRVPAETLAEAGLDRADVAVVAWAESGDEVVVMQQRSGVLVGPLRAFGSGGMERWPSFGDFLAALVARAEQGARHG